MDKDSIKVFSITYSHEIINQLGYSIKEFTDWLKINGLPCIFKGDSPLCLNMMKSALDCSMEKGTIFERPEFVVPFQDREGIKKSVIAQNITIIDPTPEGIFVIDYIVIKGVKEPNETSARSLGYCCLKMKKNSCKDSDLGEDEMIQEANALKINEELAKERP